MEIMHFSRNIAWKNKLSSIHIFMIVLLLHFSSSNFYLTYWSSFFRPKELSWYFIYCLFISEKKMFFHSVLKFLFLFCLLYMKTWTENVICLFASLVSGEKLTVKFYCFSFKSIISFSSLTLIFRNFLVMFLY